MQIFSPCFTQPMASNNFGPSTSQFRALIRSAHTHPRYHDERMINYDTDRGVSVTNDAEGSTLTVENASAAADSGNYTCSPYNIRPSWVVVHVLSKGNSAAAVQVRKSAFI